MFNADIIKVKFVPDTPIKHDTPIKKASIRDVADAAAVSVKTVSRVLNDEKYVSKALQDKVRSAMKALDYSPNLQARGLASSRSYMIGLLIDDMSGDYITRIQKGMLMACDEAGSHLVVELLPKRNAPETDEKIRGLLNRVNFDGVVLTPPVCDDPVVLKALRDFGIPVVRVGGGVPDDKAGRVEVDDYAAAVLITNHLIDCGHISIGFVQGDPDHQSAHARERGFLDAMEASDLSINPRHIFPGAFSYDSGVLAANQIVLLDPMPTAFFVCSDSMAAGVASVLLRLGVQIPEDVSLVGFDDDAICTTMFPQLSTVHQPVVKMAHKATKQVIEAKASGKNQTLDVNIFDCKIIERQSVFRLKGSGDL